MSFSLTPLFTPYPLNANLILKNRTLMAPMTRNVAHEFIKPTQ